MSPGKLLHETDVVGEGDADARAPCGFAFGFSVGRAELRSLSLGLQGAEQVGVANSKQQYLGARCGGSARRAAEALGRSHENIGGSCHWLSATAPSAHEIAYFPALGETCMRGARTASLRLLFPSSSQLLRVWPKAGAFQEARGWGFLQEQHVEH